MTDNQSDLKEKTPSQNQNEPDPTNPKPVDDGKAKTIYGEIGEPDPGTKGAAAWADDWREQLATGDDGKIDEKQLAQLKRYDSPKAWNKSNMAAQQRIRSGEYKRAQPKDDTPESLKAWREENQIPEDAKGYEVPTIAGVDFEKLDDGTKENINAFRDAFHKGNLSVPQAKAVTDTIMHVAERQLAAQAAGWAKEQEVTEDTLRTEWGSNYRNNIQMNIAHLEQEFGEDATDVLMAVTPSGRRLVDMPHFSRYLNANARANGADEMVSTDGNTRGSSADARIAEIENIMNTNFSKYDMKMADEYQGLLEKRESRRK